MWSSVGLLVKARQSNAAGPALYARLPRFIRLSFSRAWQLIFKALFALLERLWHGVFRIGELDPFSFNEWMPSKHILGCGAVPDQHTRCFAPLNQRAAAGAALLVIGVRSTPLSRALEEGHSTVYKRSPLSL